MFQRLFSITSCNPDPAKLLIRKNHPKLRSAVEAALMERRLRTNRPRLQSPIHGFKVPRNLEVTFSKKWVKLWKVCKFLADNGFSITLSTTFFTIYCDGFVEPTEKFLSGLCRTDVAGYDSSVKNQLFGSNNNWLVHDRDSYISRRLFINKRVN